MEKLPAGASGSGVREVLSSATRTGQEKDRS